jgi:hypothetical protein
MTEQEQITNHCDAIADTYLGGGHSLDNLLTMRRELAVYGYRLGAFTKQAWGEAGMTYLQRKYAIAKAITDARAMDAAPKATPMNVLEVKAQQLPSVVDAQEKELWAEASKEALKVKLEFIRQVLGAMTQEISVLSHEMKTTAYQSTSA